MITLARIDGSHMHKRLTRTQQRLLDSLGDGRAHAATELRRLLRDDMAVVNTLQMHLSNLRMILHPHQQIAWMRLNGVTYYYLTPMPEVCQMS